MLLEFHVDGQRADFLHQDVERLRHARDHLVFAIDDVELEFTEGALRAVVEQAEARGTGARGLRSILEGVLNPLMFDLPSRDDVAAVTVTEETVREGAEPELITHDEQKKLRKKSA